MREQWKAIHDEMQVWISAETSGIQIWNQFNPDVDD